MGSTVKTASVELTQQEANLVLRAMEVLGEEHHTAVGLARERGLDLIEVAKVIDRVWNKVFDAGRAQGFGNLECGMSDAQTHDPFDYPEEDDVTGYPV